MTFNIVQHNDLNQLSKGHLTHVLPETEIIPA